VVVTTDNAGGKLLPYMTANLRFTVGRRNNVLSVPNAALRFRPTSDHVAEEYRAAYVAASGRQRGGDMSEEEDLFDGEMVWVVDGGYLRPVGVEVGLSDGIRTEVRGKERNPADASGADDLAAGAQVVTGVPQAVADEDTTNPFAPRMFRKTPSQ
jgi:HlyD family secretion protein